jgi:1-acyl-sn-glycerol-3-phosphate acyltransferase
VNIRGSLALAFAGTCLLVGEVVQRTVIAGAAGLAPSKRHRIFTAWQQLLARTMLAAAGFVGGARFEDVPRIPNRAGVLVLMNHQSLMDIPMAVRSIDGGYPRIVTRVRYARGKPLISHMVRLYQYPTVDPKAMKRADLRAFQKAAGESPVPLVLFPEGTRTRDGSLGRFKRTGLRLLLSARQWEVWTMTVDGWWQAAKLKDFVANISDVEGRIHLDGPFTSPAPDDDPDPFIRRMEEHMAERLAALRAPRVTSGDPA